jgi:hypothetical protein
MEHQYILIDSECNAYSKIQLTDQMARAINEQLENENSPYFWVKVGEA